jgi:hypothetical protein
MDTDQEELYLPWRYNAYFAVIINQNSRRNTNFFHRGTGNTALASDKVRWRGHNFLVAL